MVNVVNAILSTDSSSQLLIGAQTDIFDENVTVNSTWISPSVPSQGGKEGPGFLYGLSEYTAWIFSAIFVGLW